MTTNKKRTSRQETKEFSMSKQKERVGLFSDIGKTATEILYKDYNYDGKFSITTQASDALVLTSNAVQKGRHSVGDVAALYRYKNAAIDVKVDTQSNVDTRVTLTDVLPSVKTIASVKLPDMNSAKVEVQYFHEHATIGSSLSLRNPPILDISATYGTATTVFGVEAAYNTSIGNFTKYNAAISMMEPDFCRTLTLADKGDLITASYVKYLDQVKATIAVEFTNRFSEDGNTLTVGGSYNFDESTLIKLKLSNKGNFGTLLQHEIRPKTLLTMATEFDYNSIDTSPKVGVSLALRP